MPPCAAVCMLITVLFLPLKPVSGNAREKLAKIDYAGSILSLAANIFVLIPISSGGSTYPWNSAIVISMLVIGGLLWIAFVIVQWKFAKLPILPCELYGAKFCAIATPVQGCSPVSSTVRIWTYRTTALNLAATFLVGIICKLKLQQRSAWLTGKAEWKNATFLFVPHRRLRQPLFPTHLSPSPSADDTDLVRRIPT